MSSTDTPERGAAAAEYVGLIVIAALVIGALFALGGGLRTSVSVRRALCEVVRSADSCVRPASVQPAPESGGGRAGAKRERHDGGCHGFWGCTWSATRHVAGGIGGAAKDTWSGITSLVEHPLTSGKNMGLYLWSRSPIPQSIRAWKSCRAGDAYTCADSVGCLSMGPNCLVSDLVLDEKAKQDLLHHRWGDGTGRILWNGGTLFVPTKVPGLNRLGAAGKTRAALPIGGAEKAGKLSKAFKNASKALQRARKQRKTARSLSESDAYRIGGEYRKLNAADRAKFLDGLTPQELQDVYNTNKGLRADILAEVSPEALARLEVPNPRFPGNNGVWTPFKGSLFGPRGPVIEDIVQGGLGDCWCLATMGAIVKQSPELIKNMIKRNPNGTFTVTFGDGRRVTVTSDLPKQGAREKIEAGWPAILEKATAERAGGYDKLGGVGDYPDRAMRMFLGRNARDFSSRNMRDIDLMATDFRNGDAMVLSLGEKVKLNNIKGRDIFRGHSYAIVGVDRVRKTVTLRNPMSMGRKTVVLTEKELRTPGVSLFEAKTR